MASASEQELMDKLGVDSYALVVPSAAGEPLPLATGLSPAAALEHSVDVFDAAGKALDADVELA